jgi:hypothetical protein
MVDKEETTGSEPKGSASAGAPQDETEPSESEKRSFEAKLDDFADKFSGAVADGVKRMENAFEKGAKDIRDNPNFSQSRVRGFFTSSAGGSILVVIGFIWLFYAIGLLDNPVFPALMIIVGFYIMHRFKASGE